VIHNPSRRDRWLQKVRTAVIGYLQDRRAAKEFSHAA